MSEDLLFHMADTACVRAWEDEGWGPYHKRLLTMCVKREFPGTSKRKNEMSPINQIMKHLRKVGHITIREAMDDYSISGGHLTKIISTLKNDEGYDITTNMKKHPVTGRRYAKYVFVS